MKTKILVCVLAFVMIFSLGLMTACGEAGADGKDGVNGTNGTDGVGIEKTEIVGDKLVITYTDGTTEELNMPSSEVACDCTEDEKSYVEVVKHSKDEEGVFVDGKYIYVCECGLAEIVDGVVHNYENTDVAATCTTVAFNADVCTVCGDVVESTKVTTGPALGHDYAITYPLYTDYYVCDEGGVVYEICKVCDYKQYAYYAADELEHSVTKWTVTDPKVDATFEANGVCEHCTKPMSVTLPAYSDTEKYNSKLTTTVLSCAEREGTGTYTIYIAANGDAETLSKTAGEGYVAITFTTELTGTHHTLNGKLLAEDVVLRGTAGVTMFANTPVDCENDGQGYYNCEVCNEMITVEVEAAHTWGEVSVVTAATCTAYGTGKATCTTCNVTDNAIPLDPVPHSYTVSKVLPAPDGKTSTLVLACSVCNAPHKIEKVTSYVETKATCVAEGKIEYKYLDAKGAEKSDVLPTPTIGHALNGVEIIGAVPASTTGVEEFANSKATCAAPGNGYFTCETCKEPVTVVTTVNHTYDATKAIKTPATCTEDGKLEAHCTVCCAEGAMVVIETYPAAHDMDYDYTAFEEATQAGYIGKLVVTCNKCTDVNEEYDVTVVDAQIEATCKNTGVTVYTVAVEEGGIATVDYLTVVEPIGDHIYNGKEIDTDAKVNVDEVKGITQFKNTPASCVVDGTGSFTCEYCDELLVVTTTANHVYKSTSTTPATCEKDGVVNGVCTVENCGDDKGTVIPATGHKYTYKYDAEAEEIVFTCSTCAAKDSCCTDFTVGPDGKPTTTPNTANDCAHDVVRVSVKNGNEYICDKNGKVTTTEPTCATTGIDTYTWTVKTLTDYANKDKDGNYKKLEIVVTYNVVTDAEGHSLTAPKDAEILEWVEEYTVTEKVEGEDTEVAYKFACKGYVCEDCGKLIVISRTEVKDAE